MQLNRNIPAPVDENVGALSFWLQVVTTCQLTAVQILDDMVTVNFQHDDQDSVPVPVLTWYFWKRAADIVQAEQAMSDGARQRDLIATVQIAQDLQKQLEWLGGAHATREAAETNALHVLHQNILDVLKERPFHPMISDQSYGGVIAEPKRIQLVMPAAG